MRSHVVKFLVIGLALIGATQVPAPIYSGYPGLEQIIARADHVVVAEITANPVQRARRATGEFDPTYAFSLGMHEDYEVRVLRTIKGELEEGEEYVVGLRHLGYLYSLTEATPDQAMYASDFGDFSFESTHLLFLQTEPPFSPYNPEFAPAIAFTENCVGAHYPLMEGTDLQVGVESSPEALIAAIVESSASLVEGDDLREFSEWLADQFLGEYRQGAE